MTIAVDDSPFPSLLAHALRQQWGVGIFAGESDGKRRYLFEDGQERILADGFYQMMHRVEQPNAEQQAAFTRLRAALAKRNRGAAGDAEGSFFDQLLKFHEAYPEGFSDQKWVATVRGQGAGVREPRHRQPLIDEAQAQLSRDALDALLKGQKFAQVWDVLVAVLRRTDLVPAAQLKLTPAAAPAQRTLALAVRELLHGEGPYEQRFDSYVAAFTGAFGHPPKWELATAPAGIFLPQEQVCVETTTFRKQLKLTKAGRSVPAQPNSAAYASFRATARIVANKLAEHGEVPRDLFDVRDFVILTLATASAARAVRATPAPKPKAAAKPKHAKRGAAEAEAMDETP